MNFVFVKSIFDEKINMRKTRMVFGILKKMKKKQRKFCVEGIAQDR